MQGLNLFKQGVVAPQPEETIEGDSVDSTLCYHQCRHLGKASHLPFISVCMWCHFQSTAHL